MRGGKQQKRLTTFTEIPAKHTNKKKKVTFVWERWRVNRAHSRQKTSQNPKSTTIIVKFISRE